MTTVHPDLDERTDTVPVLDTTDGEERDRFSHYVPKDKIVESAVTGEPVRALCGKLWTPSRDPEKYPVCPTCKEVWASMSED